MANFALGFATAYLVTGFFYGCCTRVLPEDRLRSIAVLIFLWPLALPDDVS